MIIAHFREPLALESESKSTPALIHMSHRTRKIAHLYGSPVQPMDNYRRRRRDESRKDRCDSNNTGHWRERLQRRPFKVI
jgi:hypothetical protein